MVLLCKQKALYVKCCIIANGVTDSQGDTLYQEDIKKIFTSFNNQDNFEIYHNDIPIQEVSLLENYISTADETIGTAVVPSGSWNAVIRVDNPEIKEALLTNEFQGVSLSNRIAEACKSNLSGTVRYKDIADAECVIPIYISFVKAGANGYGLHVMDYDAYILKSKDVTVNNRGAKNMAFDLLGGLKKLVQQAEADNEPIIIKEDPEKEEEPVVEKADETTEPEKEEEEATVEKEDDAAADTPDDDENDDEPVVEKEDEEVDLETRVAELEAKIAELEGADKTEPEEEEEAEEPEDEDTPRITKSRRVLGNEENTTIQNTNYFDMSGRDPVTGKAIRK